MVSELRFTVHGRPQAKGSKRALQGTGQRFPVLVDQNKRAKPWAGQVSAEAARAMGGTELIRTAVVVELGFFYARPKSHFGTGKNAGRVLPAAPRYMTAMPDIDKLARCALDALTGVVFKDDAQVTELRLRKGYGEPERAEVRVVAL
jgi:Holliday junction resolvase RusA-like endonuclease